LSDNVFCIDYREDTNKELDTAQWKLEIEDELEEVEEEAQALYKKKIAEYEEAVKKQAEQTKAKVQFKTKVNF
jgi:hypothetical protein